MIGGVIVTGTNTGIGKTCVARALVQAFSLRRQVTYFKPVQTGCVRSRNGMLESPDYEFVTKGNAAGAFAPELHVPYRFRPACSPHLAAEMTKTPIVTARILSSFRKLQKTGSFVVAEGAGGLLVPLNQKITMLDLIKRLGLPAVLVTSPELGTLNHTFLSLETLRSRKVPLAGVVVNNTRRQSRTFIHRDNLRMIRKAASPAPFLEMPFGKPPGKSVKDFCRALEN